ncbi:LLM class flavin-dependent oxidoreductase [Mycolicibacterium helvum]|nr:LLM class flavin-dependent oxidoreductase [Mycolicibacterium helvum]
MRHAIYLPLFGALSDPSAIADIAAATEQAGWDGLFVWDHVLSPVEGRWEIADPWIALAAAAMVTERIRLGPMVTPLPRRRVLKLARETVTLDRLSRGRLIVGLGTGGDIAREYSAFGEDSDARRLGQVLDDGTAVLTALWAGQTVTSRRAVVIEAVEAMPGPVQQPRIPLWFGTARAAGRPIDRAARYDGIFPLGADAMRVARIADAIEQVRGGSCAGFDIAVAAQPGDDLAGLAAAGATWALHAFWPGHRPDQVLRVISRGAPD